MKKFLLFFASSVFALNLFAQSDMTRIGLPVPPPGFTITTEMCDEYYKNGGTISNSLRQEIREGIQKLEKATGKKFGGSKNPLLVSVKSDAWVSMPGMTEMVLNVGLNSTTIKALIKASGNERFVYDSYRRLIQMYADVVMGMDKDNLETIVANAKTLKGVKLDTELSATDLKELSTELKDEIKIDMKKDFPENPEEQLIGAVEAVFRSWNSERAIAYRKMNGYPDSRGTAVTVQTMVFGNMGATGVAITRNPSTEGDPNPMMGNNKDLIGGKSDNLMEIAKMGFPMPIGFAFTADGKIRIPVISVSSDFTTIEGVAYTRNPSTGKKAYYGEFLIDEPLENLIAGIKEPHPMNNESVNPNNPLPTLENMMPDAYKKLTDVFKLLEEQYKDMLEVEFTIEKDGVYIRQIRIGTSSAAAALKIALDMLDEGLIDEKTAVSRVRQEQIKQLLEQPPLLDPEAIKTLTPIAKGSPMSPGTVTGTIVFSAKDAEILASQGKKVILVRGKLGPEDIMGMKAAEGILTEFVKKNSHTPVIARDMDKPCVSDGGTINATDKTFTLANGKIYKEGDVITIDGSAGNIYDGDVPKIRPENLGDLERFMTMVNKYSKLRFEDMEPKQRLEAYVGKRFSKDEELVQAVLEKFIEDIKGNNNGQELIRGLAVMGRKGNWGFMKKASASFPELYEPIKSLVDGFSAGIVDWENPYANNAKLQELRDEFIKKTKALKLEK